MGSLAIPIEEASIRREIWQNYCSLFGSDSEASISAVYGGSPRSTALLSMFLFPGHAWVGGYLLDPQDLASLGQDRSEKSIARLFSEKNWRHPLAKSNEQDSDHFLLNNLAVRAFRSSLEKTLRLAGHEMEEADRIVSEAARRIYPEYSSRIEEMARACLDQSDEIEPPRTFPPLHPDAPIFSMPQNAHPGFVSLALEALGLPAQALQKEGLSPGARADMEDAKKWAEKWRSAIRKQFSGSR